MPTGGRAVGQRRELEQVTIEEDHQLPAVRAAAAGGGHGGDVIGHLLLLEAGEFE